MDHTITYILTLPIAKFINFEMNTGLVSGTLTTMLLRDVDNCRMAVM